MKTAAFKRWSAQLPHLSRQQRAHLPSPEAGITHEAVNLRQGERVRGAVHVRTRQLGR